MTASAWALLAVAGGLAVGDWIAVSPGIAARRVEYVLKPAVMIALIAVALSGRPHSGEQRAAFVVGLALSLAGDVFLMLPSDRFVAGLAAFLGAHIAYIVGFSVAGVVAGWVAAGAGIVVIAGATLGRRIVGSVRANHRELTMPVSAYVTVISATVVLGVGRGSAWAAAGALLFYSSDALIAWDRFAAPVPCARPAIMATYHLAQASLVLSLAR